MLDTEFDTHIKSKLLPVVMNSDISIVLEGLLAHCHINQTFTNTSDEVIEAIHTIPVPVESTLTAFKVSKNNQTWMGRVFARTQADTRYEQILDEGNSAFQLKREDDFISLFLGQLASKETLSLELSLIFPIQFMAGEGQLYLPLVMGERYGYSNLAPEQEPSRSFLAEYPFKLSLIANYLPLDTGIESPSHPLIHQGNGIYEAQGLLDRDLKIIFSNLPEIAPTIQTIALDENNTLGLITLITPHQATEVAAPRDVLFVLDCSGSMEGARIQQLKESVHAMLSELRPQDRFNLYPYGSHVEQVFDTPQIASAKTIMQAKQHVRRRIHATLGGTETVSAMLTALMSYQQDRATDLVLITDGEIWFDEQSIETKLLKAYAQQHNIRFFTVGVGHATTENTVKTLAEMSNGSYVVTNPHEDIQFQMQKHFKRLYQPDVQVTISTPTLWKAIPKVYQGDALLIPMWFETTPKVIDCAISINDVHHHYALEPQTTQSQDMVKWIASQRFPTIPSEQQTAFAVQHQILTDKTDYLIEMERAEHEKITQLASVVQLPQMEIILEEIMIDDSMYSRRSDDYINTPALLRRNNSATQKDSLIEEVNARQAQCKQEQIAIDALVIYLNTVKHQPELLNYQTLKELNTPKPLIDWLRLGQLTGTLANQVLRLEQYAKTCEGWEDLVTKCMALI